MQKKKNARQHVRTKRSKKRRHVCYDIFKQTMLEFVSTQFSAPIRAVCTRAADIGGGGWGWEGPKPTHLGRTPAPPFMQWKITGFVDSVRGMLLMGMTLKCCGLLIVDMA